MLMSKTATSGCRTRQQPDGLLAVGGFAYYLEPLAFQKHFQSLTNKGVIVGENYSDRHFISPQPMRLSGVE